MDRISLATTITPQGIELHHGKQKVGLLKYGAKDNDWAFWPELHDPLQSRLAGQSFQSQTAAEYVALAYFEELFEVFERGEDFDLSFAIEYDMPNGDGIVASRRKDGLFEVTMFNGDDVHWSLTFHNPEYAWTEWKRWVK